MAFLGPHSDELDNAPKGYEPLDMFGTRLVLDLDADNPRITIATGVSVWPDNSLYGNDVSQATGAAQPTLAANQLNGHAALNFNGSQFLSRSSQAGVAAGDNPRLYCIGNFTGSVSYTGMLVSYANTAVANRGFYLNHFLTSAGFLARRNGAFKYASGLSQGGASSVFALYDGRNATSDVICAINGTDIATLAVGASVGLDFSPDRISIGALEDGTQLLSGAISRVICVNPAPTANEHAMLTAYFKFRYPALGLP